MVDVIVEWVERGLVVAFLGLGTLWPRQVVTWATIAYKIVMSNR